MSNNLRLGATLILIERNDKLTIEILKIALGAFGLDAAQTCEKDEDEDEDEIFICKMISTLTGLIMNKEYKDCNIEAVRDIIDILTREELEYHKSYGIITYREACRAFLAVVKNVKLRELAILSGSLCIDLNIKKDEKHLKASMCSSIISKLINEYIDIDILESFFQICNIIHSRYVQEEYEAKMQRIPQSPIQNLRDYDRDMFPPSPVQSSRDYNRDMFPPSPVQSSRDYNRDMFPPSPVQNPIISHKLNTFPLSPIEHLPTVRI